MRKIPLILATLAVVFLSGCAASNPQPERDRTIVDDYTDQVHRNAARTNADVYWVNPPDEEDLDEYEDES